MAKSNKLARTLDTIEPLLAKAISAARAGLQEVAALLAEVRDGKLYREGGYATFAQYVDRRWGRSDTWARGVLKLVGDAPRLDGKTAESASASRNARPRALPNREPDPEPDPIPQNSTSEEFVGADVVNPESEPAWLDMQRKIDAAASLISRTVRALLSETAPGCEAIQAARASIVQQCDALTGTLSDNAPVMDTPDNLPVRMPAAERRGWMTRHEARQQ